MATTPNGAPRRAPCRYRSACRRYAKAIPAPVEHPVAADEGAARRGSRGGVLRRCCRCQGPQNRVRRERRANRGREVAVQKARRLRSGTSGDKAGAGAGEELQRRIRLVVARVRRRARAVGEALPGEEVGRIGTARDVHVTVRIFGQQVEPTRLMVTHVALL